MAIVAKEGHRFEYLLDSDDMDRDFVSNLFHSKTVEVLNKGNSDCNLLGSLSVPSYGQTNKFISFEVASRYQDGSILLFDRTNDAFHFLTASGLEIQEQILDYSIGLSSQTIDGVVKRVGEENVLGRGTFSTVVNESFPNVDLAVKVTAGQRFLDKEYQETRTDDYDHRMSLVDHLRVRQIIEDANIPFICQPKLYGFSLFLDASKDQIVEVIYMEAVKAQSFEDVYSALRSNPMRELSLENKLIFEKYFNSNYTNFALSLLGSYVSLNQELQELSEGRIQGRIGDVNLGDPGGSKNVLVDGYDPKSRRFKFILLDVTEYERKENQSPKSKKIFVELVSSFFTLVKSYFSK